MSLTSSRFHEIINGFEKLKPILVLGDLGVDKYTYGSVSRISPEAPVPVLEVTKEWEKLGLAANVADNLKSLGVASTLCGVIGEDINGESLLKLIKSSNLSSDGIIKIANRMTTYKERVVTETQQICRIDYETKDDVQADCVKKMTENLKALKNNHGAIIVEDYGKGLITNELMRSINSEFKDQDYLVAVDPSRTTPPEWYKDVDLLKPNKAEALIMVKSLGYQRETNLEKIAEILVEKLNLKQLIITLGADGMGLMDTELGNKLKIIPTAASEVFDVSGAGDTAISAIVASLNTGATLEESAWIGNCASGVVVGKKGTAKVDIQELTEFFDELEL